MKKLIAITSLAALMLAGVQASQYVYWDFGSAADNDSSVMATVKNPSVGHASDFVVQKDFDENPAFLLARPTPIPAAGVSNVYFTFSLTADEDIYLTKLDDYALKFDHAQSVTLTWDYYIADALGPSALKTLTTVTLNPMGEDEFYSAPINLGFDLLEGQTIYFRLSAAFGPSDGSNPAYGATLGFSKDSGLAVHAIPEPSTWLLLGVGAVAVAFLRRRK